MSSDDYFESYADTAVHRLMLQDHARTIAFERAIEEVVRPEHRVLDVGAGTGILSFFAARKGARDVYAIDNSAILKLAKKLAAANGFADKVTFLSGLAETVELPHKVDVIVSEWLGFFALAETMFESFVKARDRHLQSGGITIPSDVRIFLAPIDDNEVYCRLGPGFWERPVHGFDYSSLVAQELSSAVTSSFVFPLSAYLCEPHELAAIDCVRDAAADFYFDTTVEMNIERAGTLRGFAGHFEALLAPNVVLSTGPDCPTTHWRQSYFPTHAMHVDKGDRLQVRMSVIPPQSEGERLLYYHMQCEVHRAAKHGQRGAEAPTKFEYVYRQSYN